MMTLGNWLTALYFLSTLSALEYPHVDPKPSFKSVAELPFASSSITLSYGDSDFQFVEGWLAAPSENKDTLVAIIHGGCWLNAFDITHSYPMATALSQSGLTTWSIEYRRTGDPNGGWPNTFNDVVLGLEQIVHYHTAQANRLPQLMYVLGHSAGGHLALLATHQLQQKYGIEIKVIGLAAIVDIETYALGKNTCQSATAKFMNGLPSEKVNAYRAANPKYLLSNINGWLLHGDQDEIVPLSQAQSKEVLQSSLKVEVQPEASHFDWIHPGSPAFAKILEILTSAHSN